MPSNVCPNCGAKGASSWVRRPFRCPGCGARFEYVPLRFLLAMVIPTIGTKVLSHWFIRSNSLVLWFVMAIGSYYLLLLICWLALIRLSAKT
jgi:hypothetical protein